ncbi:proline racemase family protein [Arthrobacter sp. GCM10027362]|uniref:proline racemase family protein n=1 Tax=Arthrobacter sp. GCM10027362 TaxID=3273379 RepID=UPI00364094B3
MSRSGAGATSRGRTQIDLGWGGTLYAGLDAASVGLEVSPANLTELIALGREVKAALADDPRTGHLTDPRLSEVYGTIIFDVLGTLPTAELHQRNVTIFADGQVDRSPCGSGSAARVGVLTATGTLHGGTDTGA